MYSRQGSPHMNSTAERCPVCSLYLLPNMLLAEHLETHPKDQVIRALTTLLSQTSSHRSKSPWHQNQQQNLHASPSHTLYSNNAVSWQPETTVNPPVPAWQHSAQGWVTPSSNQPPWISTNSRSPNPVWSNFRTHNLPSQIDAQHGNMYQVQGHRSQTHIPNNVHPSNMLTPVHTVISQSGTPSHVLPPYKSPGDQHLTTQMLGMEIVPMQHNYDGHMSETNMETLINNNDSQASETAANSDDNLSALSHDKDPIHTETLSQDEMPRYDSVDLTIPRKPEIENNNTECEIEDPLALNLNNTEGTVDQVDNYFANCDDSSKKEDGVLNLSPGIRKDMVIINVENIKGAFSSDPIASVEIIDKENAGQSAQATPLPKPAEASESKDESDCKIIENVPSTSHNNEALNTVISRSYFTKRPKKLTIKSRKSRIETAEDSTVHLDSNRNSGNSTSELRIVSVETLPNASTVNLQNMQLGCYEHITPDRDEKIMEDEQEPGLLASEPDYFDNEPRTNVFSPNLVFTNLDESNTNLEPNRHILNLDEFQKQNFNNRNNFNNLDEFRRNLGRNLSQRCDEYQQADDYDQNAVMQYGPYDSNFKTDINMKEDDYEFKDRVVDFVKTLEHSNTQMGHIPTSSITNGSEDFRQSIEHSSSSESLNIRTDEKMPARGELSEQESTDSSTWVYQNASSSFSLNVAPSNDINLSQFLSPILEPSSSTSRLEHIPVRPKVRPGIFKCTHCAMEFPCAKERRVHLTREHPGQNSAFHLKKSSSETLRSSSDSPLEPPKINKEELETYGNLESNHLFSLESKQDINHIQSMDHCSPVVDHVPVSEENGLDAKNIITEFQNSYSSYSAGVHFTNDLDYDGDSKPEQSISKISMPNFKSEFTSPVAEEKVVKVVKVKKRFQHICAICKIPFSTLASFNDHLIVHPLECGICGKLFTRKQNLDSHTQRHLGIRVHSCSFCEKRFFTKQKRIEHENVHKQVYPLSCNLCDSKFRRFSNLSQHKNSKHFKNTKTAGKVYFCFCGENFPSIAKLCYHKETHDLKPKNCQFCTQKFIHAISVSRHIRLSHNDKMIEDTVPCTVCNKNLSKTSLSIHMKTHNKSTTFNCFICNKNFSTKWNLKQHRFIHQNRSSKPFKCHLCNAAFVRSLDFRFHLNAHKKIYSFVCNFCGRKFIRKYNYLRHVKEHTSEKRFHCSEAGCEKTFHRKYYLTEHVRTHSGLRPYVCTICSKSSTTKSNHNKHLRIHHASTRDNVNMEN